MGIDRNDGVAVIVLPQCGGGMVRMEAAFDTTHVDLGLLSEWKRHVRVTGLLSFE